MPPPAEGFAARLVLGPALRTQSDHRLVSLVREGYEAAFEEIVRRYGKPLTRYAAAIVGSRCEDVTQDAFSKALLALRGGDAEIELRPWLFRIVRNTALNDLRDSPPSPEALAEAIAGGRNPAEEAERREELAELMRRLQALPEPQRAAIVMRELEGLSHEQIAAALGLSGGAARQAIYRARQALRSGLGVLLPLPLLRALIDHGGELAAAGAGAGGAVATGGTIGGVGAGVALKAGVVTAVLAGSVGTGIALRERNHSGDDKAATERIERVGTMRASRRAAAPTEQGLPSTGPRLATRALAVGEGQGHGEEMSDEGGPRGEGSDRHGSADQNPSPQGSGPDRDDGPGHRRGHGQDRGRSPQELGDEHGRGRHEGSGNPGESEGGSHSGPGPRGDNPPGDGRRGHEGGDNGHSGPGDGGEGSGRDAGQPEGEAVIEPPSLPDEELDEADEEERPAQP